MNTARFRRYAAFATLYLAQGSLMSYFAALNAIYLMERGVPLTSVGVVSAIAMVPFVLKIFLGMLSDRVNLLGRGHRLPYIVLGLVLQAAGLAAIAYVDPAEQFTLYCAMAFAIMTAMALYDTCTDGLAVDTTPPEEEGTVQGIMVAGRSLGVVIISLIIGLLAQHSWLAVFWALAAVTLLPLPMLGGLSEAARSPAESFRWSAFRSLGRRVVLAVALFGALNSIVSYGANELVNPFLKETFGISNSSAGAITALWGAGAIVGGLLGGRLADRWGHRRTVLLSIGMAAIAVVALSRVTTMGQGLAAVAGFGIAFGCYEALFFALAMAVCEPDIAASMYAILMAIANIGTGIGLAAAGALAEMPSLGYGGAFLVLGLANALVLAVVPLIFRGQTASVSVPEAAE